MQIRNLTFRLPDGREILRSINLRVEPGEGVFVFGLNGAGKSTLALALSGILTELRHGQFSGEVLVGGRNLLEMAPFERTSTVGLLLQDPELQVFSTNLRDEIGFVLENLSWPEERINSRVEELLQAVGLADRADDSPALLSQGQKQLLALCVAIAPRPELIILDEPSVFLDPSAESRLWSLISQEKERGAAVIVMGSWPEYPPVADKILTLHNGELIEGLACDCPPPPTIRGRVGGDEIIQLQGVKATKGDRMLEFGDIQITDGLTTIVGSTGSGKTTLTKLMVGLEKPSSGQVSLMGRDISEMKLSDVGRLVGYVFQSPEKQLIQRSVEDEIAFSLRIRGRYSEKKLHELLDMFELEAVKDRFPLNLSGGELKRVAIASVFALEPDFLIMDEPEANLDPIQLSRVASALSRTIESQKGALITSPFKSRLKIDGEHGEIAI